MHSLFVDTLKFSPELWHVDFNHNFTLKNTYTGENISHTEVIDAAVAPTCTTTGLTEGRHCSVCNEVFVAQKLVNARDHYVVMDAAVPPTCTTTGLTQGKHCSVCNEVLKAQQIVNARGHNIVIDAAVAPTCTTTGLTEGKHCSVCNEVFVIQQIVSALDHDHSPEWTVDVEPTCTTFGSKSRHCSRCDDKTDITEIDAKGHTSAEAVEENNVATSCTTDGSYDSVVYCSECEEELSRESKTINKLGHHYSTEWTVDVEPTCTTVGSKSHRCSRCDDKVDATEIPENGHSYDNDADSICNICNNQREVLTEKEVGCRSVISSRFSLMMIFAFAASMVLKKKDRRTT